MKRLRVDEPVKEGSGPLAGTLYHRQPQLTNSTAASLAYSGGASVGGGGGSVKVVSDGMQSGLFPPATPVNYGTMPAAGAPHSGKPQAMQPLTIGTPRSGGGGSQLNSSGGSPPNQPPDGQPPGGPTINFQRLKVEDALSYLDMVKFKFSSKPQVYNDFLDIMKEFKSQSIDTPGVIQRVSNLFKGFPELIVGFNTFLPPGYKIEVQKSDQGYAFQVSVSMPSPTGGSMTSDPSQQHQPRSTMVLKGSGTISNMSGGGPQPASIPTVVAPQPQVTPQPPPSQPPQQREQQQQQQPQQQQQQPAVAAQPIPLTTQHISPIVTQQPTLQQASNVHHGSNFSNNAPAFSSPLHLTAAQAAVALQGNSDAPQNQPVEFNHAINYVNKIKNRFQGQPEKYKKFLEILHTYQKEQRTLKESSSVASLGKHLTEQEVYSQVAKLFENQNDLLAEFGQFLPDATNHINQTPIPDHQNSVKKQTSKSYRGGSNSDHILERHISSHKQNNISGAVKRSPPYSNYHREVPPTKKHKMSSSCRDVSLAEASKYGTLNDYAFFDKVRKAVRSQEVYNNFLRCLTLFNQEIVSKSELIQIVTPFLSKFPELLRWFRVFMGQNDVDQIPYNVARQERPQGDHALEIDLATAKRLGASYCIIPKAQEGQRCSGRTQLCKEVLNDQWVSFPTWSEDSTFVSSRKTQYEEYMYRCEDERFELDVVIETNASTIRVLEGVNKKLSRMNPDEVAKYKLDDCLGGTSPTLHQRALRRIYGDKAQDIIDGLKRNPAVAVPVVLRRLKAKEDEWREAQKGFNKIWREQNEKYYLKSLDHQGINFKQTDVKALRSKSLFNEIETIFDERHEQNEEGADPIVGPHLVLHYKDRTILDDAANLIIHHIKRQTGTQKGEKRKIKYLLRQFLPDLFFHPRQPLSDDEREDDDDKDEDSPNSSPNDKTKGGSSPNKSPGRADGEPIDIKSEPDLKDDEMPLPIHAQSSDPEEAYTLFMANNNWYIFLRLHAILCDRLAKIYERACIMAAEETESSTSRKESTAIALRLKPKPQIEIEDYYPAFLDMVKNVLDGNMESNTYEDTLREMFGIHAYIAFTLDKVVQYAVRQLQHCVTERTAAACMELFFKEQKRGGTGGPCATAYRRAHLEMQYQRGAEKAVQDENCFKIFIYKKDCRMTMELLDTEPEDTKKVEDTKKWNAYKERYADCANSESKQRSPVYLNRNLRLYKKRIANNNVNNNKEKKNNQQVEQQREIREQQMNATNNGEGGGGETSKRLMQDDNNRESVSNKNDADGGNFGILDTFERKLNDRPPPERNQTEHVGYEVSDETQCKFNSQDSKIMFTVNKDSYLYKISAFYRARQSHPNVTKQKANRFRAWSKHWISANVSDVQVKLCTDWMMGRGDGVVPNRTRVLTDNDLTQSPYTPYNRYRVDKLTEDST